MRCVPLYHIIHTCTFLCILHREDTWHRSDRTLWYLDIIGCWVSDSLTHLRVQRDESGIILIFAWERASNNIERREYETTSHHYKRHAKPNHPLLSLP